MSGSKVMAQKQFFLAILGKMAQKRITRGITRVYYGVLKYPKRPKMAQNQ
jgi:hypothetical protein